MVICCTVFTLQNLLEVPISKFAISARDVVSLGEYYRLLSSPFVHVNFRHVVFNVISTVIISGGLERSIGSILMLNVIVWSSILQGCLYVAIQLMVYYVTAEDKYYLQRCAGFSGVLFALAVMESYGSVYTTRYM